MARGTELTSPIFATLPDKRENAAIDGTARAARPSIDIGLAALAAAGYDRSEAGISASSSISAAIWGGAGSADDYRDGFSRRYSNESPEVPASPSAASERTGGITRIIISAAATSATHLHHDLRNSIRYGESVRSSESLGVFSEQHGIGCRTLRARRTLQALLTCRTRRACRTLRPHQADAVCHIESGGCAISVPDPDYICACRNSIRQLRRNRGFRARNVL
jgi:hypothetical protein